MRGSEGRPANPVWALILLATTAAAEPFGDSVPMQQRASGNYYVAGTLHGGVRTDFMVDTGSGYVSLSPAVFERLQATAGATFLRYIVGSMANGQTVRVPVYRIPTLELSPECVLQDVEITVMPGSHRNILGLSALRRVSPFALDLQPARLMLSDCTPAAPPLVTARSPGTR
ncbi:MAG: retroviral-like aspartic protease family protein [Steroidobacteraceae bacterium]|jgi:predicted aspartyl protease|nr:retroviral-like aspartic protease family protein [Steroidobacteraceae bacterium]